MAKLAGKNAIVTGAAGGIGAATARLFLEEGANVVLVDLEQKALDDVARSFDPSRVLTIAADVSQPEDADRYVNEAVGRFGRLDVLFANAGIEGRVCPLTELPVADFDRVLAVNVRGVWLAIRAAARQFQKNRGGSIIATSSVAGGGVAPRLHGQAQRRVAGRFRREPSALAECGRGTGTEQAGDAGGAGIRCCGSLPAPARWCARAGTQSCRQPVRTCADAATRYTAMRPTAWRCDSVPPKPRSLAAVPGVVAVRRERMEHMQTDAGPEWIGADRLWNGTVSGIPATKGEGMVVGVIDTGINPGHPSFAANGPDGYTIINPRGHYFGLCSSCQATCNSKLIGIYDFTDEGTKGVDSVGHGSHVSGIVAGDAMTNSLHGPHRFAAALRVRAWRRTPT